jgi:AraC-like DNA-binding protein
LTFKIIRAGKSLRVDGQRLNGWARMYRNISFGVDRVGNVDVARHIHRSGYATVVLVGSFTEAAFAGRVRAEPGMVLLHGPFDCHANVGASKWGPTIIRLPWRNGGVEGAHGVRDPDLLARVAERDPFEAEAALTEMIAPIRPAPRCWVDDLASTLRGGDPCELRRWAERRRLAPTSVSRGFKTAYQVSPRRFQLDARTRRAWMRIMSEPATLTCIAHECGFSDLAHMSRSVASMTGAWPSTWRRSADRRPTDLLIGDA